MTLIKRLREASGPSRDLDAEITEAVYPWVAGLSRDGEGWTHPEHGKIRSEPYTASLDCAMTLVPEGWNRRLSERDTRHWWAELREGYETCYNRVEIGQHATPAIALTIACLLARGIGG